MKTSARIVGVAFFLLALGGTTFPAAAGEPMKGTDMLLHARGPFTVKVAPVADQPFADGIHLGRYSLDKQYQGDLGAVAKGEMLTAGTAVEGSAGYVAIERVEGALGGKRGSFALQHLGRMSAAGQELTIQVVPDSGTGELLGLQGRLAIEIGPQGEHTYDFVYSFASRP